MRAITKSFIKKKLSGNVSLLVILILLASSVIALLSINQIQHLLTYGNMTFNYFRSYYLAKAWTELWLTEVYYREAWFNQKVKSWDSIVLNNLLEDYSAFNPYFTMEINSKFNPITNDIRSQICKNNMIHLEAEDWIMLSLFYDVMDWINEIINTWYKIEPLDDEFIKSLKMVNLTPNNWTFTFWIFSFNDANTWMDNIVVKNWENLNDFLNNNLINGKRRYLTIKNAWNNPADFCISWDWDIPYSNSLITVRANYWDVEVWLQSIVEKTTPSWSLNVLWTQNTN